jgi:hypothetical protein
MVVLAQAATRGDHWLQGWFRDVGGRPATELEHVREFHEKTDVVFAALVQVLTSKGRIERIEGFGSVVVFRPQHCLVRPGRPMRAQVRRCGGHTVLEVSSDAPPLSTLADRKEERVQVHHLLNLLAHRLHGSTRLGRASAFAHAHEH